MGFSDPFIRRPVGTTLLALGVLAAGVLAYRLLPVAPVPSIPIPGIVVFASDPGATPVTMANTVAAPLEHDLGLIPGLEEVRSISSTGAVSIILLFSTDSDINSDAHAVQAAIDAALPNLPSGMPALPYYREFNPASRPILTMFLSSRTRSLRSVYDFGDTVLLQKLSQVKGVAQVTLYGGQSPAVRIRFQPSALAAAGLAPNDIYNAVRSANVLAPLGMLQGRHHGYILAINGQLRTAAQYRRIVLRAANGSLLELGDVASVVNSVSNTDMAATNGREPGIVVAVTKTPTANIIKTVHGVKLQLPEIRRLMPSGIHLAIQTNRTTVIRAGIDDLEITLLITLILVLMVVAAFMRHGAATLAAGVTIPLAIAGTLAVMWALGFSLDNFSLLALTIAITFVVDDAIVMIENISRYLEEGMTPLQAALTGAGQIGFTIVSLTVSLVAVLIPLLFMGDVVGRLFREFAVTLAVTIVISAIVSLTLTPMMCSRILRHNPASQQTRFYRWSEHVFNSMIDFYGRTLRVVLRFQTITLLVALGTLVLTVYLYIIIPKGFFPVQDTGVIQAISQAPEAISFSAMSRRQQELDRAILKDPAVESLSSFIGVDGINTTLNSGRIEINLKPLDQRHVSAANVIRRLQKRLANIPGIHLYMQPVQDITVDDRVSRTLYQYTLEDPNTEELNRWTAKFVARLKKLPDLEDVATDQQTGGIAVSLLIDRVTASRLGIAPTTIDNTLYDAYGQRQISTLYTQLNQYHVILQTAPKWAQDPANLGDLYIPTNASSGLSGAAAATTYAAAASASAGSNALTAGPLYTPSSGALTAPASVLSPTSSIPNAAVPAASTTAIPLKAFTKESIVSEPLSINHQGQFPSVTVSFNLAPHGSLGTAISQVNQVAASLHFPASLQSGFEGTAAAFQRSLSNEALLILAALVTVYIVLGVLYESFIHPITILSTLPSAGVGALLALMIFHQDLSVVGIIGIILLIGIVKKNGIMIVDFALEAERERGKSATDAIFEASMLRFRPIMMTTMAALLGGLPLALGRGLGSELRRPLGIAMVGGLLLSQILTLYTTPVIYIFFDNLGRRLSGRRSAPQSALITESATPSHGEMHP